MMIPIILSCLIYAKRVNNKSSCYVLLSACAILISILNDFKVEMPLNCYKLENSEGYLYMFLGFALASYMVAARQ